MTELHATSSGQVMRLTEMADGHLRNTIVLAQRRLQPYLDEHTRRNPSFWRWLMGRVRGISVDDDDYVSEEIINKYGDEIDHFWEEF